MMTTRATSGVVLSAPLAGVVLVFAWSTLAAQDSPSLPEVPDFSRARSLHVRGVLDEHTLLLGDGREQWRVRLIGVASPRWSEAGEEARLFLERLLSGESVYLIEEPDSPGPDRGSEPPRDGSAPGEGGHAGRERAAYLYRVPDGLFVNLELVRQGFVPVAARERFTHRTIFRLWEDRARAAEKGIWARPDRPASQPRRVQQERPKRPSPASQPTGRTNVKVVYVTRTGEKYHLPDCPALRGGGRAIPIEEARKRYAPCSRCQPPP
jgi:endonuclease YncB( thermonuclease family)